MRTQHGTEDQRKPSLKGRIYSLSARLLILTAAFVMLAELFIFAPSIANYRQTWLNDKINSAHLAILALDAAPNGMVSHEMEKQLLGHVGVESIVMRRVGMRQTLFANKTAKLDATFDLREPLAITLIIDAFDALLQTNDRMIRVIGNPTQEPNSEIEIIFNERLLCAEILSFSGRIVILSLVISIITASLVFLALQWLMVKPMRQLTENMTRFAENPEDESRIIQPGARKDEIGRAQQELNGLQYNLLHMLKQKEHLAALGTAVAKINHDLRGILSTALVVSDRLEHSSDPKEIKKFAPTLISAIDRAVKLCGETLNYVGHDSPPTEITRFDLAMVIHEICDGLGEESRVLSEVPQGQEIEGDRDHMYRILTNLIQNAKQAGAETVRITLEGEDQDFWLIDIEDDGPGLPPRAEKNLFKPFQGSARSGGTGLGLVTSRELVRAQGGDLWLLETSEMGTVFRIHLPHHIQ